MGNWDWLGKETWDKELGVGIRNSWVRRLGLGSLAVGDKDLLCLDVSYMPISLAVSGLRQFCTCPQEEGTYRVRWLLSSGVMNACDTSMLDLGT